VSTGKELLTLRTRVVSLKGKAFQEISDCSETVPFSEMAVTNVLVDMALAFQVTK
jgi:hypothetical protein